MGKPFSDLEKRAIAILANGGNPAQSNDSEVAKYWQWRISPTAASHKLPTDSKRTTGRKLDTVYIDPFGGLPSATLAKASVSKRAGTDVQAAVKTACAYDTTLGSNSAYSLKRFRPAKVYFRTGAGDSSADRLSRITGRTYRSYYAAADQGYTLPFGKASSTDTERSRITAIRAAIATAYPTGVDAVSFSPEKFNS